jgi:hypothetical protein
MSEHGENIALPEKSLSIYHSSPILFIEERVGLIGMIGLDLKKDLYHS